MARKQDGAVTLGLVSILGVAAGYVAAGYLARRHLSCGPPTQLGRLESRITRVRGMAVHARVSVDPVPDDRLPVVLVHGLGMSSRYMVPIARHLAPAFRVYAPDLPGFGLSDKPDQVLTIRELADALAAWMRAVGLERAALIGNSLGGEIIVELALRHPRCVDRLVLQGPTPDPTALGTLRQVAGFFVTAFFERRSLAWVALSDYLRGGFRRYLLTFLDMVGNRIEAKLPGIEAPTLVVWGTRDYIVPYASARKLTALLPNARLVVIPGAAHAINYSHPGPFKDILLPFLLSQVPLSEQGNRQDRAGDRADGTRWRAAHIGPYPLGRWQ